MPFSSTHRTQQWAPWQRNSYITSSQQTHINPCFLLSSPNDDPRPLERGSWHQLHPGDQFSLLPGRFIYRVAPRYPPPRRCHGDGGASVTTRMRLTTERCFVLMSCCSSNCVSVSLQKQSEVWGRRRSSSSSCRVRCGGSSAGQTGSGTDFLSRQEPAQQRFQAGLCPQRRPCSEWGSLQTLRNVQINFTYLQKKPNTQNHKSASKKL